jgi:hypothetical protein
MAGVAGLEPVTSAVTGQRSNQLSYTPAKGGRNYARTASLSTGFPKFPRNPFAEERIRAADAKEVGVGNPAEETYRYPNQSFLFVTLRITSRLSIGLDDVAVILYHIA